MPAALLLLIGLLLQPVPAAPPPPPPAQPAPSPPPPPPAQPSQGGQPPQPGPAPGAPAAAQPPAAPKPVKRPARPRRARPKPPPLILYHVNRRETLALLPDARGFFPSGTQRKFNHFMRCHHTGRQHSMAIRLLRLIEDISHHFDNRRIDIVAGYRAPAAARNPKSPHKRGLAADLRVDGVSNAALRDFCRTAFQHVGVGYYPNSSFVHIDVRKNQSAFWIDYSGPGEAPLYSRTPNDDLQTGRAETFKPGKSGEGEGDFDGESVGAGPLPVPATGGPSPQKYPPPE
ncbi:MAG TPA: DUF882 domain-containing protein [Polyangia bacterium]|nr:DUF882 domain-containing protein [Polyangia bacterium]